jgi:6-phosphogluconolactonase (cycloisomerase 2 family)
MLASVKKPAMMSAICLALCSFPAAAAPGLEYIESISTQGMEQLIGVTGSRDGRFVYSLSGQYQLMYTYNKVNAFSRDSVTGKLGFLSSVGGYNELRDYRGFAMPPDNRHLYVMSGYQYIYIHERNDTTGKLVVKPSFQAPDSLEYGSGIALSPDGRHAYVVSGNTDIDNYITVYRRDTASGGLTGVESYGNGVNGVSSLGRVHRSYVSPDGRNVYTIGEFDYRSTGGICSFARDSSSGLLSYKGTVPFTGYDLAVSPDGKNVYASSYQSFLCAYSRDSSGALTLLSTFVDNQNGVDGLNGAYDLEVSPNGRYVFAAAVRDSSLCYFIRNPSTGNLTFGGIARNGVSGDSGLAWADGLFVSPDGQFVYVTAKDNKAISCYRFTEQTATSMQPQRGRLATYGRKVCVTQGAKSRPRVTIVESIGECVRVYNLRGAILRNSTAGRARAVK